MPDIFGRMPEEYEHIRMLQEENLWERHQQDLSTVRGVPTHTFDQLGAEEGSQHRAEVNAQAFGYMTNNLLAVQSMIDEILYLQFRLPDYIHLEMGIDEGADTYGRRVRDRKGRGKYIDPDGSDAPRATSSRRLITNELDLGGIDAYWTLDEVRGAMFAGVPLETEALEAAVAGALEHMEEVGLVGDTDRGTLGLLNQATASVTYAARAAGQEFSALTAVQVRDLINQAMSTMISNSKEIFGRTVQDGLSVYLPTDQYNQLTTKFVGDNQEWTVMRALMEDNPWKHWTGNDPMFHSVVELDGAGASGSDRMVVTLKDRRVGEMGVSIMPRVIRIEDKGREFCAPVEYKFAPFWAVRPKEIHYYDNV